MYHNLPELMIKSMSPEFVKAIHEYDKATIALLIKMNFFTYDRRSVVVYTKDQPVCNTLVVKHPSLGNLFNTMYYKFNLEWITAIGNGKNKTMAGMMPLEVCLLMETNTLRVSVPEGTISDFYPCTYKVMNLEEGYVDIDVVQFMKRSSTNSKAMMNFFQKYINVNSAITSFAYNNKFATFNAENQLVKMDMNDRYFALRRFDEIVQYYKSYLPYFEGEPLTDIKVFEQSDLEYANTFPETK